MCPASSEIVARDTAVVIVAGLVGRSVRCAFDPLLERVLAPVDDWVAGTDVVPIVLDEAVDPCLKIDWEPGLPLLPDPCTRRSCP